MSIPSQHELFNNLQNLSFLSEKLNKLTDEANQTVQFVESHLENARMGVSHEVDCVETPYMLSYERIDSGKFRIVVREHRPDAPGAGLVVRPWSECTRDVKLTTVKSLPQLLTELAAKMQNQIAFSEKEIAAVAGAVQKLKPAPKK